MTLTLSDKGWVKNIFENFRKDVNSDMKILNVKLDLLTMDTKTIQETTERAEQKAEKRYDQAITQLVDITGQFKKFDEERLILSDHSKNHEDRIEKIEKKLGLQPVV